MIAKADELHDGKVRAVTIPTFHPKVPGALRRLGETQEVGFWSVGMVLRTRSKASLTFAPEGAKEKSMIAVVANADRIDAIGRRDRLRDSDGFHEEVSLSEMKDARLGLITPAHHAEDQSLARR